MSESNNTFASATGAPSVLPRDTTNPPQTGRKQCANLASTVSSILSKLINLPSRVVARFANPSRPLWQGNVGARFPLATRQWHPEKRRGASILEVLVACTLLSAVLSVATPLVIRHNRLLTAHHEYQMALDEVSNQLERLTALPAAELPPALEQLAPSELAAAHLNGAKLTGELEAAGQGQRLTLHLIWDEPQRKSAPVSLAAWIYRRADAAPQEASP
jgi:hypothetical protein